MNPNPFEESDLEYHQEERRAHEQRVRDEEERQARLREIREAEAQMLLRARKENA